jgi:hypothetical protein
VVIGTSTSSVVGYNNILFKVKSPRICADVDFDTPLILDTDLRRETDRIHAPLFNHPWFTQEIPSFEEASQNASGMIKALVGSLEEEQIFLQQELATLEFSNMATFGQPVDKTVTSNITRNPDGTVHRETVTTERMPDGSTKTSRTVETRPDVKSLALRLHEYVELPLIGAAIEERCSSRAGNIPADSQNEERVSRAPTFVYPNLAEIVQKAAVTESENSSEKEKQGEGKWNWFWSKK